MKELYPELYNKITLYIGSFEETLCTVPDNSYDVCLIMGTGKYIHPANNSVFSEMVRISRKYILTVENEVTFHPLSFPRNFKLVFESLGCRELDSFILTKANYPKLNDWNYIGCTARLIGVSKEGRCLNV